MKFKERLIMELKYSKLTQKEIAEKLGISEGNITNWKNGENLPSLEVFYSLCNLLEVSADYMLGIENKY
jgi:transcriptional regulator with XRE-family HTH domain